MESRATFEFFQNGSEIHRFSNRSSQFWLVFTIVVYEKIYFEAYTND